tara:strand:- start:176 stop:538 length:363 start_codon:yes stop_codon:yes gene_type:complete
MSEFSESLPLIDANELEKQLGSDNELLAQIVELFAETYPETFDDLEAAIAEKQAKSIRRHAHTLKGIVANLGAKSPAQRAFEIETMSRDNNLEGIEDKCAHLKELVSAFHQALLEVEFAD